MEDLRANSPCELAMDELELLHRMSLTDDALHWVQQNADWLPKDDQPMVVVPYDYGMRAFMYAGEYTYS